MTDYKKNPSNREEDTWNKKITRTGSNINRKERRESIHLKRTRASGKKSQKTDKVKKENIKDNKGVCNGHTQ